MLWNVISLILKLPECLAYREDMLFLRCPKCTDMIVWRPFKTKLAFSATCCFYEFYARPTTISAKTFKVTTQEANMKNVRILTVVDK